MDSLIPWLSDGAGPLLQLATSGAASQAMVFLLTAARLSGFFLIGHLLGRSILSWPVRIGLVILLTLIVAPNLTLSTNPIHQVAHESQLATPVGAEWSATFNETSITSVVVALSCEAAIGAAFGLSVVLFLSGLKLAGEWIDRHSGLGLGGLLNPEYSTEGSAPTDLVTLLCVATLLVMQPINGHLLVVRCVLDSFHAIPVGAAALPGSLPNLVNAIVQQSLILGLRVAMPFVVAMSLLDMTLGWARRTSQFDLNSLALVFRVTAGLLLLMATLPGIQHAAATSLMETLKAANDSLAFNPP